ncbi:uncharacterized protein LOC111348928 [Spodoptera litura]|uniref:Uncharacterized protein LOC111348928 n=1 Tax=Spodoptera litura TaxID=69820 RepID=A0A9J7IHR6_SPOLT|nr:uncharacterized protein LOC111348928 [Spodoptera litura]
MLIISLIIFHAISASFCYDVEIEGVLKLGKEILRVLDRNEYIANNLTLANQISSKGKLPSMSNNMVESAAERSRVNIINNKFTMHLEEFTLYLGKQGEKAIEKMGKQILYDLKLSNKNITSLVNTISNNYVTLLHQYYVFLNQDISVALVENDFLYLDMIDTYCRLLYNGETKLLSDIVMNNTVELKTIEVINTKISRHIIVEKKEKLNYLCKKYKVCKEYSTFTDRCRDLISQLLLLPEAKFQDFVEIMSDILKKHSDVLEDVAEKKDRKLILLKLKHISSNIFSMKEFLAVLRAVISPKFRSVTTTDKVQRHQTIAARILFEIIDKALNTDDNVLEIDFDNTISSIDQWSNDVTEDVEALPAFVDITMRIFKYRITKNARKEIKVLITTILGQETRDHQTFHYLFTDGSKYVRGGDFNFDVDDTM